MANWAALELNPWTSRVADVHEPTWALIDIDPGDATTFAEVRELARLYCVALDHLGVVGCPKVTGKRGIPIVAILDSNSSPDGITFPVPGNDDAIRAIQLYCDLFSGAVLDGLQQEAISSGRDIGEAEDLPAEQLPAAESAAGEAAAAN